jgi:hypothetical protein
VALSLPTIPGTPIDNILWLLLLAVCLAAGLIVLLRRWPAAAWYLLLSGGILMVWPYPIERLFAPLLPILAGTVLVGLQNVVGPVSRRASLAVPLLLASILVPLQVRQHLATSSFWYCDRRDPYTIRPAAIRRSEELVAGARFVRDSLETGTAVATYRTATVAHFSGHKTAGSAVYSLGPVGLRRLVRLGRGLPDAGEHHAAERGAAEACSPSAADWPFAGGRRRPCWCSSRVIREGVTPMPVPPSGPTWTQRRWRRGRLPVTRPGARRSGVRVV